MKKSLTTALLLAGCGGPAEPKGPPPVLTVTSPARSLLVSGSQFVEVRGTAVAAEGGTPVKKVTVNGTSAIVAADGSFVASVPVESGATLLRTSAKTSSGMEATDTRSVRVGEMRALDALIPEGMTVRLSDEVFATVGNKIAAAMTTTDFAPLLAPANPMVNAGDGPDCLYAQVDVLDFDVATATVHLRPETGGLFIDAELTGLYVPTYARYAFSCIDDDRPASITADSVHLTAQVALSADSGRFVASIVSPSVQFQNLIIDTSGFPGAVLDLFSYDSLAASAAESMLQSALGPQLGDLLTDFTQSNSMDVAGHTLEFGIRPTIMTFDSESGNATLDSRIQISDVTSKGFVYTENGTAPALEDDGFLVAIADDAVNQLLAGVTDAGLFNLEMPLPEPRSLFDSAKIQMDNAPMVTADLTTGKVKIIAGDMRVTLLTAGIAQAQVMANVEMELTIGGAQSGVKLNLGKPSIYFNTVTDEIPNTTGYTDEDLGKVLENVSGGVYDLLAPLFSFIPLPMLYGVNVENLAVEGHAGFIGVTGTIR